MAANMIGVKKEYHCSSSRTISICNDKSDHYEEIGSVSDFQHQRNSTALFRKR